MKYFTIFEKKVERIFQLQWKIGNVSDIFLQCSLLCGYLCRNYWLLSSDYLVVVTTCAVTAKAPVVTTEPLVVTPERLVVNTGHLVVLFGDLFSGNFFSGIFFPGDLLPRDFVFMAFVLLGISYPWTFFQVTIFPGTFPRYRFSVDSFPRFVVPKRQKGRWIFT